ncbi:MAG: sigma-70 family RNA polymerase sigma factor [Chloroflexi bacterium]|nr:sigma-70 family RNA polymerase sigma factor [Chloroflexota bacterium]
MVTSTRPLQRMLGEQAPPPLLTHAEEMALARRVAIGHSAAEQLTRKGRSSTLTPKRRRALKHQVADGDAAREALILHNLRLVLNLAGRFRNESLTYDDLVQEGIFGLLKAAERYDPKRGTRFATFAVWWIRQSIGRAIANLGRTVRLPVNRVHKISQLRRIASQMAQHMGNEPLLDDLADSAGVTSQVAASLLQDAQDVLSLDAPLEADDREAVERMADRMAIDPENAVSENSLKQIIEKSLAMLDEREAEILRLRFGLGGGEARPLRAIAAAWQMSPEGVRQISQRALSRLRTMPDVRGLGEFLKEE